MKPSEKPDVTSVSGIEQDCWDWDSRSGTTSKLTFRKIVGGKTALDSVGQHIRHKGFKDNFGIESGGGKYFYPFL